MKKNYLQIFAVGAIAFLLSIPIFAQRDRTVSTAAQNYVISAKAGGVNYVEGSVTITRADGKSGYLLKTDTVGIGDKVTTGASGKAEILLNPGSYARLAPNSEFEFVTTSLDDLKLKLNRGSAMLEVFAANNFMVEVNANNTKFYLIESGVYRIDAIGASAKIEVWEGRAQVGDANPSIVKDGRQATVGGGEIAVAKFDRDEKDSLELWSKSRARELAKINSRLERNSLRHTLLSSFRANNWDMYNSFGLWIYDASFSGHCFLPFGMGWNSPYGYNLGWNLWNIRLPQWVYYQPVIGSGNGNVANNGNGTSTDRGGANNTTRDDVPPFQQIQNSGATTPRKVDPTSVDLPSFPQPVQQPPVYVPPVVVPVPTKTGKDN